MSWKTPDNPIPQMMNLTLEQQRTILTRMRQAPDVTWGQLKRLDQNTVTIIRKAGAALTAENRFLAYLAIIGEASEQVGRWFLLLLGWSLLSSAGATVYWSHLLNPPLFHVLTWWDVDPPLSSNDTGWTGGIWLPPSGPLTSHTGYITMIPYYLLPATLLFVFPPYQMSKVLYKLFLKNIYIISLTVATIQLI